MVSQNKNSTKEEIFYWLTISNFLYIIVLLILAGVAINLSIGENGLFKRAQDAKSVAEQAEKDEQKGMSQLEASMNFGNEEYIDSNGKKAIIPAGFTVSSIKSEQNIDTGLVVIASDGSEFVWVPVENAVTDNINQEDSTKYMALKNGDTENYSGILYNFNVEDNNIVGSTIITTNYAEPRLATWIDTDEALGKYGYSSKEDFLNTMQQEYNDMVKSVEKNKGFYIARYETSLNEQGNVQSKEGAYPYSGAKIKWYELYEKQKTFKSDSVQSSMIWGSQYDAMLNWVISGQNKNYLLGITRNETEKVACGSNSDDVINQIYDLTGNTFEWTLTQGAELNARAHRGGYFGLKANALRRAYTVAGYSGDTNGSRMTLYIKN